MLPMDPRIIEQMEEKLARARNANETPMEKKKKAQENQIPDIKFNM